MVKQVITGRVLKYGENIDTDRIYPHRYMAHLKDMDEIAKVMMIDVDPDFADKVKKGDILVVGKNFGCGSARGKAVQGLKHLGISLIVAESFARIYFRNAIAFGMPIVECRGITEKVSDGDQLEVNFSTGEIKILKTGEIVKSTNIPDFLMRRITSGGLIPYLKKFASTCAHF